MITVCHSHRLCHIIDRYFTSHHIEETEAGLQTPVYLRNASIIRRILRKILKLHYNSAVPDAMEICSMITK